MYVTSSAIVAINYNSDTLILRITFKDNSIYDYYEVPEIIAQQFLNAPSKGKYYAQYIKGRFNQQRIL